MLKITPFFTTAKPIFTAATKKNAIGEARETNPVLSDVRRELYKAPVKNMSGGCLVKQVDGLNGILKSH